jgi:hypothetical protein
LARAKIGFQRNPLALAQIFAPEAKSVGLQQGRPTIPPRRGALSQSGASRHCPAMRTISTGDDDEPRFHESPERADDCHARHWKFHRKEFIAGANPMRYIKKIYVGIY